ncbi:MAG: hypothetical protein KJN96_11525 [Eudoraea sp.]|nr:hypothetical protein [Eudoraea sp.]MBT8223785.1 hypothetical protein [Eudoraea sp.]NNJ40897.1 hypothetical protein [Eudoraea sp.]
MPDPAPEWKTWLRSRFKIERRLLYTYLVVYFIWGLGMNELGKTLEIARFNYWWQVITVYLVYMVPISLLLKGLPVHMQYAYGLIAMGLLEFGGYLWETSYAYPDNLLDQLFGIRNFSLAMSLFFAAYFPLGNWGVQKVYTLIFTIQE